MAFFSYVYLRVMRISNSCFSRRCYYYYGWEPINVLIEERQLYLKIAELFLFKNVDMVNAKGLLLAFNIVDSMQLNSL